MEMDVREPVYVPSGKLARTCEQVLATIYDQRQVRTQQYVEARVAAYNAKVERANRWRRWVPGLQPKMLVTPYGMELIIRDEIQALVHKGEDAVSAHPMMQIVGSYQGLEATTKDTMIQCKYTDDVVLVPHDFIRGVSHLGLPLDFMQRPKFGFRADY